MSNKQKSVVDRGVVTFFDIKDVGFYTKNIKGESTKVTGSLIETIGHLAKWILDSKLGFTNTIPWDVKEHPKRHPIYSKAVYTDSKTNDTLFVFWSGEHDQENSRKGIKADASTGAFDNDSVNLKDAVSRGKTIVGDAMYYWFIPEHNLLATIDFQHSRLSSDEIFTYIKRCVNFRLNLSTAQNNLKKHKDIVETSSGSYTSQYYWDKESEQRVYFRFDAKMKHFSSSTIDLKKMARNITHIIARDTVAYSPKDKMIGQMKMIGALINSFSGNSKPDKVERKKIELVEERRVTEAELKKLIENSEKELDPEDTWAGMGFQTSSNDKPKFFKSFIHRPVIFINKGYNMGNYYNPELFLKELIKQRDDLLITVPSIQKEKLKEASSG